MRKLLIAFSVLALTSTAVSAQHRHHVAPRYHHGHSHGISPWVAGAVGLGILGAGVAAGTYYYDRRCWREHVGYDQWGCALYQRVCNY